MPTLEEEVLCIEVLLGNIDVVEFLLDKALYPFLFILFSHLVHGFDVFGCMSFIIQA